MSLLSIGPTSTLATSAARVLSMSVRLLLILVKNKIPRKIICKVVKILSIAYKVLIRKVSIQR